MLPAVIPGTAIAQSACTLSVQQVPCHHREGGGGEGGSEVRGQIWKGVAVCEGGNTTIRIMKVASMQSEYQDEIDRMYLEIVISARGVVNHHF